MWSFTVIGSFSSSIINKEWQLEDDAMHTFTAGSMKWIYTAESLWYGEISNVKKRHVLNNGYTPSMLHKKNVGP